MITPQNFHEYVDYGLTRTDLTSLNKLMRDLYSPMIFAMPAGRVDKKCWQVKYLAVTDVKETTPKRKMGEGESLSVAV